jgi:hypothetical protein
MINSRKGLINRKLLWATKSFLRYSIIKGVEIMLDLIKNKDKPEVGN